MKFDSRDLPLTAVFASLYFVINIIQTITVGNPTIYGPIQLRVADFLIALAVLFGWPLIGGVSIGCLLTNAYYFIGTPDVIFGLLANLIAALLVMLLRKRRLMACIIGAFPVGSIVGGYLWWYFPPPDIFAAFPAWAGMIGSLTISSLIAVAVIGYLVLSILSRPNIIEPLKSRGLRIIDQG